MQNSGAVRAGSAWEEGRLEVRDEHELPKFGGDVSIQITSEPPSLNPITDTDYWGAQIDRDHINETLLKVDPYDDPRFRFQPALAESWEVSADQKTYVFRLRRNVAWHDGHAFTADDVIATFDKVMDVTTKAAHLRAYTQEIQSIEKIDEFAVRFVIKRPYFYVFDGVFTSVPIQPAHIIRRLSGASYSEAATNPLMRAPIGTGPFRFENWTSGVKISLVQNRHYWGKPPHLERLVFRFIADTTVALELAESGELDVVYRLRPAQWVQLTDSPLKRRFQRSAFYNSNYVWIGWNLRRFQLADSRVRRALTMLIDRPRMIESLLQGLAKQTTCHFYWASEACDSALLPLPYDPLGAIRLLEEAGWRDSDGDGIRDHDGKPFRISLMLPVGSEDMARLATKIKEDFGRAGIDLAVQRVEWSGFVRRLRTHDFDACSLAWVNGPRDDPSQGWQSTAVDDGSNYVSFANERADALMQQARGELDDDRRNVLYRELGKILYEEQPFTWMYIRPQLSLFNRRLKGVQNTLLGWVFEDWWVDEASPELGKVH